MEQRKIEEKNSEKKSHRAGKPDSGRKTEMALKKKIDELDSKVEELKAE